ncbi:arylsulfatase [Fulvivirga sp. 1062]|uniref:Arylsulfatase n=2 Tax=Fulvivirga sedimenti TaxID=2879465 RepID=A0A9X1HVV5_9BACT|nr:arylsulfatase [Fulvivirga sedimenti]MCA6075124.1 arylsulfatase [Fulvivirga sedimenti]MCA6076301.1 arylsulfatase [Fulvivirga sedimenti]MCA6077429.1 arylsulfatase [Fulvivirga sedimenti]
MAVLFSSCGKQDKQPSPERPNIIIIYLDDLGYGDVSAYGSTTISTPNMDRLANEGLKFTRGYAASATCTPSRYALLTGTYPWRNKNARILPGTAPLLIDTSMITLPKMLRQQGYKTGIVGKWHLGLGDGSIDWNEQISPGPNEVGFDESYILAATQDRVPTVYIENGNVVGLEETDPIMVSYSENFEGEPTALDHPEMLKMKWDHGHNNSIVNGIPRIGFMKGGQRARWIDEDMADVFLEKAREFIHNQRESPFFLYYALQQPHVPRTPHPRFVGATSMGPRGDVIAEADWCIGELMKTLEEEGLLENTLIILSSDNGPVINDGYLDQAVELLGDHKPSGPLRGGKYSLFEAGTRVPFLAFWKGYIEPGTSDAMISQIDLAASLAELTGSSATFRDSENMLPVLLGRSQDGRKTLITEATGRTALHYENWLVIPPNNGPEVFQNVNIESGNSAEYQLYDLTTDLSQQKNLAPGDSARLNQFIQIYKNLTAIN